MFSGSLFAVDTNTTTDNLKYTHTHIKIEAKYVMVVTLSEKNMTLTVCGAEKIYGLLITEVVLRKQCNLTYYTDLVCAKKHLL